MEIVERLSSLENRTESLETTVEVLTKTMESQESTIKDMMWKMEEAENRQRRNNMRLLGIPENSEGTDIRKFTIDLLNNSLPELTHWDWEKEVQRVHRFPLNPAKRRLNDQQYTRAILIFFGNFLLRQSVFELARPDKKRNWESFLYFVRPDFVHATVERRWRLRQMIALLQKIGASFFYKTLPS